MLADDVQAVNALQANLDRHARQAAAAAAAAIPVAAVVQAVAHGVAHAEKYKLTVKRLDQQATQEHENGDAMLAIASGEAVDRELRIYQSLRVLPRVIATIDEDPETGL